MATDKELTICSDFSEYPGPRYIKQGKFSGEEFYYKTLNPAFAEAVNSGVNLNVVLDGTAGYASSFLDESFGNLVYDFTMDIVKSKIKIISKDEPDWIDMIENQTFVQWEKRRSDNDCIIISEKQDSEWYRLNGDVAILGKWEKYQVDSTKGMK